MREACGYVIRSGHGNRSRPRALPPAEARPQRYRVGSLFVIRGHALHHDRGRPNLTWNSARKAVSWLVPEALLLGAAVASLHVDALREPIRDFAPFYPIVVFGLGF